MADSTPSTIQNSFTGGELSPSLFGRTDLAKWQNGASTMRNFFGNYRGGASTRAGFAYVGTCKQSPGTNGTDAPPRDIPFQFSINQGYVLEFGDQYMRVKSDGAYVIEDTQDVESATNADPMVVTITGHGYSNGDWLYAAGWEGLTQVNGLAWIVRNKTADTFELEDMFGNAFDSSQLGAYTGNGTVARVYTAVAPYDADDLPFLKFTQNKNTMSLTCWNQSTNTEYPPYDLVRNSNTDWVFTAVSFGATISAPTGLVVTAQSSTTLSTYYSYVVTAIDSDTGEESVASVAGAVKNNDISINAGSNTISWNAVAGASSYNIYKATPSYGVPVATGVSYGYAGNAFGTVFTDTNIIADFSSVPPVHKNPFARGAITNVVITAGGNTFSQDTAGYTISTSTGSGFSGTPVVSNSAIVSFYIYDSGEGYANGDTITLGTRAFGTYTFTANPTVGQTIVLNGVTWTFVTGTPGATETKIRSTALLTVAALAQDLNASANASLNVASYTLDPTSGLILQITYDAIGTGGNAYTLAAGTYGGSISGGTLSGGASGGATATLTVGAATGTYPGVVAYYQQRRAYANTENNPDTYFFSQPGAYTNFDSSVPTTDGDAITGAPWAQQVNGIQALQPMTNGLVVLTGNGAWLLNGGSAPTLTPSNQTATSQAYNGCHTHIPPIVVNFDILYVQSKGSIIRDLSYNFFSNVFTGTDMTILSNHLFNYHQLVQWAYCEEPYKLIWVARDDGILLSLTYLKEQDVYTWARHDTNGFVVGLCSVTEPPVDALYAIIKRYVNGKWLYYSERMNNRNWENPEDFFCVDAGLSYPMTYPAATLFAAAPEGTGNITSVTITEGGSGYTDPQIIIDDGNVGSNAAFTITLTGGVITGVTVDDAGSGYVAGTTALRVVDPTGSGAILAPIITNYVTFTTSASVFTSGNVGDIIRIGNSTAPITTTGVTVTGGGKAEIVEYVSATEVVANIIEPLTALIPNDPNLKPVPAIANQWSLSTPVTTVTGLNHLEGMEVAILADGGIQPNQTVLNGSITLQDEASSIVVGLPYLCQLQTMYLNPPDESPTVQGRRKNITQVAVRVANSRGLEFGTNQPDQSVQPNNQNVPWTDMSPVKERNASIEAGSAVPLFTGDWIKNVSANWSEYGQVSIQQPYALGADVLAVVSTYIIGDN